MKIKNLKESDLELFYKYAQAENWDIEDAHIRALLKAYPGDFFIFYQESQLLGYIVALKESEEFGFISSLLVLQKFRHLGFGGKIFSFALEHLGERQVALDSVLGQEKFYEKFGFKSYFDVNTYRFITGKLSISNDHLEVVGFDKNLSLKNQSQYFQYLSRDKNVHYKAIKDKENLLSYAFIFPYKDGYKITINSEDINHALVLFFALSQDYASQTSIYIQTTQTNSLLEALAEALKMKKVSHFTRMYNKVLAGNKL